MSTVTDKLSDYLDVVCTEIGAPEQVEGKAGHLLSMKDSLDIMNWALSVAATLGSVLPEHVFIDACRKAHTFYRELPRGLRCEPVDFTEH